MSYQHTEMATGQWFRLSFCEQMAHVGAEVERALSWRTKQNPNYSRKAFERALELLDLSLSCASGGARLRELARMREAVVDFFVGPNQFRSDETAWRRYFLPFACASRRQRV